MLKLTLLLTLLLLGVQFDVAVADEGAQADPESQEYIKDMDRIHAFGTNKDLKGLDTFMTALQAKWVGKKPENYGGLILEGVGELASKEFGDDRQYELSRSYAIEALKLADRLPVEVETDLVQHVMADLWSPSGPKGEVWAKQRTQDVVLWFHAWKRVKDAIHPDCDQVRDAPRRVSPPTKGVEGWADGMSSKMIKDPVERTRFEKEAAVVDEKVGKWVEQIDARRLDKSFSPNAEAWIIKAYSAPPHNYLELKTYLEKYVSQPQVRQRILEASGADWEQREPESRPTNK